MSAKANTPESSTAGRNTPSQARDPVPEQQSRSKSPVCNRTTSRQLQSQPAFDLDTCSIHSSEATVPTPVSHESDPQRRTEESVLPLTPENLTTLESLYYTTGGNGRGRDSSSGSIPSSQESTDSMPKSLDDDRKLRAYNIYVCKEHPIPLPLQHHLMNNICKPRSSAASPRGKELVKLAQLHNAGGEGTLIYKLNPTLTDGLHGELQGGAPYIQVALQPNLSKDYLPQAPLPEVARQYKALSQPQPDVAYGYIDRTTAEMVGVSVPFSEAEESKLDQENLTSLLYLPFLTMQWKSPTGSENIFDARLQGGRDGATVVNHLHTLYERAGVDTPTSIQTSHMSIATDGQLISFFIHWRETHMDGEGQKVHVHHMEHFPGHRGYSMWDQATIEEARNIIKNITAYAIGPRLISIKALLQASNIQGTKRKHIALEEDTSPDIPKQYVGSLMPPSPE